VRRKRFYIDYYLFLATIQNQYQQDDGYHFTQVGKFPMDVRVYTINHLRTRHGYNIHLFLTPNAFQIYLHLTNIKNLFNQERLTTKDTAQQSLPPAISRTGNQNV
jgi:hypothetical protein